MLSYIENERNFINKFYKISLTNSEIDSIINNFDINNLDEFKDLINGKRASLNIGDLLLIARLCAINTIIYYSDINEKIPNDEHVYSFLSKLVDTNTLYIFGDRCQEKNNLYHFSTDDIADLLYYLNGESDDEDED